MDKEFRGEGEVVCMCVLASVCVYVRARVCVFMRAHVCSYIADYHSFAPQSHTTLSTDKVHELPQ